MGYKIVKPERHLRGHAVHNSHFRSEILEPKRDSVTDNGETDF